MHNTSAPLGEIRGTGVIKDKFGNVKGTFEFGGPASEDQFNQVKQLLNKEAKDGCNSNDGGSQRCG
jgi:hypothetical protein